MTDEPAGVRVRRVTAFDRGAWAAMRADLWPEESVEAHVAEVGRFLQGTAREPSAVLVAETGDGKLVGFAELSIRAYAEGCATDRVGYLEGWYVAPRLRRRGIGRALLRAALDWARAQGCAEFASDTGETNSASAAAHRALGFTDVGLVRCFRMDLS